MAAMRYLADKLLLCALCVALLVQGDTSGASVAALLAAIAASGLFEVLPHRIRPWLPLAVCLGLAVCFGTSAVPAASAAVLPLVAYDLARVACDPAALALRTRWQSVLACAIALAFPLVAASLQLDSAMAAPVASPAVASARVVAAGARLFIFIVPCALAGLLAWRTAGALRHEEELLRLRDDLQETVLRLRGKNRELVDAQARAEHAATLAERARISRAMHDSVGHLLTRSVLQVEALRVVHAAEPVEAELAQVKDTLSDALNTVRACVHNLHDESVDLQTKLAGIAGAYPCGVARLQYTAENPAPGAVADCLCALTREALSNAARHGRAAHVDVAVTEYPGLWQFAATDDGAGADDAADGGPHASDGLGLRSMREQVEALGGTFRAGPRPASGFSVFASIPKRKAAP